MQEWKKSRERGKLRGKESECKDNGGKKEQESGKMINKKKK